MAKPRQNYWVVFNVTFRSEDISVQHKNAWANRLEDPATKGNINLTLAVDGVPNWVMFWCVERPFKCGSLNEFDHPQINMSYLRQICKAQNVSTTGPRDVLIWKLRLTIEHKQPCLCSWRHAMDTGAGVQANAMVPLRQQRPQTLLVNQRPANTGMSNFNNVGTLPPPSHNNINFGHMNGHMNQMVQRNINPMQLIMDQVRGKIQTLRHDLNISNAPVWKKDTIAKEIDTVMWRHVQAMQVTAELEKDVDMISVKIQENRNWVPNQQMNLGTQAVQTIMTPHGMATVTPMVPVALPPASPMQHPHHPPVQQWPTTTTPTVAPTKRSGVDMLLHASRQLDKSIEQGNKLVGNIHASTLRKARARNSAPYQPIKPNAVRHMKSHMKQKDEEQTKQTSTAGTSGTPATSLTYDSPIDLTVASSTTATAAPTAAAAAPTATAAPTAAAAAPTAAAAVMMDSQERQLAAINEPKDTEGTTTTTANKSNNSLLEAMLAKPPSTTMLKTPPPLVMFDNLFEEEESTHSEGGDTNNSLSPGSTTSKQKEE